MKKIKILLLALALILALPVPVHAEETLFEDISSPAAVLMDASNMRVLYSKNGDEKHYPASITKIMTMLLALENGDLSEEITISELAAMSVEYGSSHISLQPGEKITLLQALYAANLASANDACNGISEAIGGTTENFVKMMNDRASEIGCTNTHFTNPHGLPDEEHYTTAIDMAKIMATLVKNPEYLKISSVLETTIPPTNKTEETRYLYSPNRCMVDNNEYYISEVLAAKPGYTDDAKHTYVAYAKKGNAEFVVCLMAASSSTAYYQDLKTILTKAFETYKTYDDINDLVDCPRITKGLLSSGGHTHLDSPFAIPVYITNDEKKSFKITYDIAQDAVEKEAGQPVGTANLYFDTTLLDTRQLILDHEVKGSLMTLLGWLLTVIKWLVIVIVTAFILLLAAKKIYTKYRRYQRRKKKNPRR